MFLQITVQVPHCVQTSKSTLLISQRPSLIDSTCLLYLQQGAMPVCCQWLVADIQDRDMLATGQATANLLVRGK